MSGMASSICNTYLFVAVVNKRWAYGCICSPWVLDTMPWKALYPTLGSSTRQLKGCITSNCCELPKCGTHICRAESLAVKLSQEEGIMVHARTKPVCISTLPHCCALAHLQKVHGCQSVVLLCMHVCLALLKANASDEKLIATAAVLEPPEQQFTWFFAILELPR